MNKSRPELVAQGIKALHALLVKVIQHLQFNQDMELRITLKSQGGLAKLERHIECEHNEILQTYPMSLNSLKTHTDANLAGGFQALNNLRLKALEMLEIADQRQQHANKRSKAGLSRKMEQLEEELEMQRQTNVILLRALSESLTQFTNICDASDIKIRAKLTQDALNTLRAILSMNIPPFNHVPSYSDPLGAVAAISNISDYRKG